MTSTSEYRVLARKYRPRTFAELVGQEALVRTLTNAIAKNRIPHAFLLTGIRGIGKTTTARIIARAINCEQGPTASPCGTCAQCISILEDRNPDVLEMDAASRTGVGDIRELIETVRYLPTSARTKVYIIDEVHMLSTSAFNALLKTLEEPPEHVMFIFATTELRKIPVTILSRCMRFDLRRLDSAALAEHLGRIAEKEQVRAESNALTLIATAAEGSVRDGLSLLDQAIAHGEDHVSEAQVQAMLGLADKARSFDLFEAVMQGEAESALDKLKSLYNEGADPVTVVQDLLEVTYLLTRMKLSQNLAQDASLPQVERERGKALADRLSMGTLTRSWQMLLKGLGEAKTAPDPLMAVEMLLIRLIYLSELPGPTELAKQMKETGSPGTGSAPGHDPATSPSEPAMAKPSASRAATAAAAQPQPEETPATQLHTFEEIVALFARHREAYLQHLLTHEVRLVHFEPGKIEISANDMLPADFAGKVGSLLGDWTNQRWMVIISDQPGQETLAEKEAENQQQRIAGAASHPLVAKTLEAFPGAKIIAVRKRAE